IFIRQYKGLFLRPIARQEMRLYVCELHKACKMLLEVIIHSPILRITFNTIFDIRIQAFFRNCLSRKGYFR
ncbi:MAG: hypothetical protein WAM14_09855, partial [Candidatus Nitrosopolaris sp.]